MIVSYIVPSIPVPLNEPIHIKIGVMSRTYITRDHASQCVYIFSYYMTLYLTC